MQYEMVIKVVVADMWPGRTADLARFLQEHPHLDPATRCE